MDELLKEIGELVKSMGLYAEVNLEKIPFPMQMKLAAETKRLTKIVTEYNEEIKQIVVLDRMRE